MVRGVRIKNHWGEQRLFTRRALFAASGVALLTLLLAARLYVLQVVHHAYYSQLSEGNRIRVEPIPAARGRIYSRYGTLLAADQPVYQLELTRDEVPNLHETLLGLVKLGLLSGDDLPATRRTIDSRPSFDSVPIRLRMSDEEAARFAVHRWEFPGVSIKSREGRLYPFGSIGVFAIGYVGAISVQDLKHINDAKYAGTSLIGKTGVEASYEKDLHGINGYRDILVDAQGRRVRKMGALTHDLKYEAPVPGDDLILSLDLKVQRVAEHLLKGHDGAVVAINPWNGDVIAMASSPTFNPNLFARGISEKQYWALTHDPRLPLYNRALRAELPSGSTIKPAMALGALTDGVIKPQHEVYAAYAYHLPGSQHLYHNANHETCGWMDLRTAIIMSCDVYFYQLAHAMGIDRISAWLPNFGFGRLTGIDIPGEQPGLVPSRAWKAHHFANPADRVWFPGDTVILGIGQGYFLTTPLQLAHYAGILATRGLNFRPRVVTGLRNPRTGKIHWKRPVLQGNLTEISAASWKLVVKAMVGVTTNPHGTAYYEMRTSPYPIAGKTGTAQLVREEANGDYDKKTTPKRLRDDAWFIAFAPAQDPRIAVAVLDEHAGWGSTGAAPIARKVMNAYLLSKHGQLLPDPGRGPLSEPTGLPARVVSGVRASRTPLQLASQPPQPLSDAHVLATAASGP